MSESKWKVIGASGFVGSSIVARLNAEGISVDPIEAPRLATRALDVDSIIDEADQLEGIIDSLAEAFAGAQVVVNAAGLAAPNMQDLPPLVGANALLPAVIAIAAQRTGVRRVIHLSSAAVQGPRLVLDASEETNPFSAYSFSKALGEEALLDLQDYFLEEHPDSAPELCILRATSVQGRGRRTTELRLECARPRRIRGHARHLPRRTAHHCPAALGRRNRRLRNSGCRPPQAAAPARMALPRSRQGGLHRLRADERQVRRLRT